MESTTEPRSRRSGVLGDRRPLVVATLTLVAIYAAAVWSVALTTPGSDVAAWWPAAGLSASLVALSPLRRWPGLAVALALVTALANMTAGRDVTVSLLFGAANATEAVLVAWVLGAHVARPRLESTADLRRLGVAALVGASVIGLLVSATVSGLEGGAFLDTWQRVLAAHAAGLLIVLPVTLLAVPGTRWGDWHGSGSRLGGIIQVVATLAVVATVFSASQDLPLSYICLPFITWAALQLHPWMVAVEIFVVAVLVNVLVYRGGGPFFVPDGLAPETSDALVQLFLLVCVVVALPLALALGQRRVALDELTHSSADLQTERDFTAAVLDTTDSLIVVVDRSGRIVRANVAVERISGLPLSQLVGSAYADVLLLPGSAEHFRRTFVAAADLSSPPAQRLHQVWCSPAGAARTVTASIRPLDRGDATSPLVVTGQDVTEQVEAQALLRSVLDATTATSIIGTDNHGLITFFNAGSEAMLGYTAAEIVGLETPARFHVEEEVVARSLERGLRPGFEAITEGVRRTGEPERQDWTYRRKDGSTLVVSLTVSARTDADGTIHGFLGVAADVTERRRAEESLRTALDHETVAVARLHELDRIKTDFISSTSHELRTPLTSVLGFSQLLATESVGPVNERQRALLGRIEKNGKRLLDLVENLLTLATLESGTLDLHQATLDLRRVVTVALDTVEETLRGRDLTVDLDLGSVPVMAWGDQQQLERAVINLLSNAIKFTDDGGRVEVRLSQDDTGASLRVTDTGMGIPLDEQALLFTRFFRASSAAAAAVPGTGLGLSIVHAIVEAHEGRIEVVSAPGEGTTFVVRLPTA